MFVAVGEGPGVLLGAIVSVGDVVIEKVIVQASAAARGAGSLIDSGCLKR